jgi:hypothetical protein
MVVRDGFFLWHFYFVTGCAAAKWVTQEQERQNARQNTAV